MSMARLIWQLRERRGSIGSVIGPHCLCHVPILVPAVPIPHVLVPSPDVPWPVKSDLDLHTFVGDPPDLDGRAERHVFADAV